MSKSLTVIVPAFNEENNIVSAIDSVKETLNGFVDDWEIIVIDDGSTDNTRLIAQTQAQQNTRISVVSNEKNMGFGYAFRRGLTLAQKSYISVFPGDNDMSSQILRDLVNAMVDEDIVITYIAKTTNRSVFRRFTSRCFVLMMNSLFGLKLKYYNGPFLCKLETIRSVNLKSYGLAMVAELIVRLLKSGHTYKEIGLDHTGRKNEKSKAFTLKSIISVIRTIFVLIKDIHFSSFSSSPKV